MRGPAGSQDSGEFMSGNHALSPTLSPKFRITIQGFAAGVHAGRVRMALGEKFALTPSGVEQLLANQAGPLVGLMEHQDAWTLRNDLQSMGVECRIAPVPRAHLHGVDTRMSLQGTDPHRHIGQAPSVYRSPRHAMAMRAGRVMPERHRPRRVRTSFNVPPLLRVAVVVGLTVAAGFALKGTGERPRDTVAVADSVR